MPLLLIKNIPSLLQIPHSYRADIDGLRALAVLAVVGFHAFPAVIKGGFIGVDIFFVISGYLISGIILAGLQQGNFNFWAFYQRRIARIFPALLLVVATSFALGWLLLQPAEFKLLGKHILSGAVFASNFVYWQEAGYFDAAADTKILLHLWSLAVEEQFYVIWPLLFFLVWKLRLSMLAVIVSLFVASFAWNVLQIQSHPVATFYSPLTRVWELLTGAMLALSYANNQHHIDRPKFQNLQSLIGFSLIFCAIYFLSKDKRFPGWWALLPTLGSYLIISSGPSAWFNRVVLSNRLMVWIGLISYPLYLWHWPLLAFLRSTEIDAPSPIMLWLTIGLSFALAGLSYLLIERPLRFGQWWRGKTRLKMAMLTLAMVGVALGGYATYTHNGYSSRFPPPLRNLLDYQYDYGDSNGACMVGIGGDQSQLEPYCYTKKTTFKKSVALWGDSYTWHLAAALNKRGLEAQHGQIGFNLIASAGCAPILNADAPYCKKGNQFVLDTLLHQQFDTIVLAANWTNDFQPALVATLQKLHNMQASKQLATKDIFLIGPAPTWLHGLFKTVINAAIKDTPEHRLPARLNTGLTADFALDAKMRALAQRYGVTYISLLDILCNAEGCMTKLSDEPDALIGYDQGHLSLLGAQYVVSHFPAKLFE